MKVSEGNALTQATLSENKCVLREELSPLLKVPLRGLKNPGGRSAEKLSMAPCRLLSQCNCLGKWISEQQRGLFGVRQALRERAEPCPSPEDKMQAALAAGSSVAPFQSDSLPESCGCGLVVIAGARGKGPMETVPFRAITCPYLPRGGYGDSKSHLGTLLCLCCHGNRCLPQLCLL